MACYCLSQRRSYSFVANVSQEQKSGVDLRFKHPLTLVCSFSPHPRVLVVVFRHVNKFDVAFLVGHMYNHLHEHKAQWKMLLVFQLLCWRAIIPSFPTSIVHE